MSEKTRQSDYYSKDEMLNCMISMLKRLPIFTFEYSKEALGIQELKMGKKVVYLYPFLTKSLALKADFYEKLVILDIFACF